MIFSVKAFSISLLPLTMMLAQSVQAVNLNYEGLSSLEQPLAAHYADTTFTLTGLIDSGLGYNFDSEDSDATLLGNFQFAAETQLANSWTLGAAYFGEGSNDENADYDDRLVAYVEGVWGSVFIGNATTLGCEITCRKPGVGNAELSFDQPLGQLGDVGVTYIGRFGPSQLTATVDDDGGFQIGSVYQRPLGNKDYRLSLVYRQSDFLPGKQVANFDSKSLVMVAELTYGSTVFDLSAGTENLSLGNFDFSRQYLSVGVARKIGVFTFSTDAYVGESDGKSETAFALGLRYDLARGLSLNLGLNHSDASINVADYTIVNADQTELSASLRYGF